MPVHRVQAKGAVSIAVADWSLDEHMTGKYAVPVGGGRLEVQLEGNFWPAVGPKGNWCPATYLLDTRRQCDETS